MEIATIITQRLGEFVTQAGAKTGEFISDLGAEAGQFLLTGAGAATGSAGALGIILLVLAWIFWFVAGVGGFIYWVVMTVDCAQRDFKKKGNKTAWILVLLLSILGMLFEAHLISALIYYFAVKRKSRKARVKVKVALPKAPRAKAGVKKGKKR